MLWKDHSRDVVNGSHALLSASKYSWLSDTKEDLIERYKRSFATALGTSLHEFSSKMIKNKIRLSKTDKHTILLYLLDHQIPRFVINLNDLIDILSPFINDAIGFQMESEQVLYYSEYCYGTADAISFNNDILRIHDLKTGTTNVSFNQLKIYAALFCLEYKVKPNDIQIELRIYQRGEVTVLKPEPNDISEIMDKIIKFDKYIKYFRQGEE
ncbi:MAG: DUF2800 domain-containing protein [Erysipelotrichia bacterium]|nr:DUF2800 domain-containing protein [Erysipelotrichia bacterium]